MPRQQQPEWKNRIQRYGLVRPDELIDNPNNWRVHSQNQLIALEGALEDIGWVQNVVVNTVTGNMVDGHARVLLAKKYKQKEVPVTYVSLTAEEERRVLLVLDPISAMAQSNMDVLNRLIADFQPTNLKMDALIASLAAVPTTPTTPTTDLTTDQQNPQTVETKSTYKEQYGVVVLCASEAEQEQVYTELQEAGYEHLKVVTT